jgi:hypothetical protein
VLEIAADILSINNSGSFCNADYYKSYLAKHQGGFLQNYPVASDVIINQFDAIKYR